MAATLILFVKVYAAAGVLVALVFLTFGLSRIAPAARHAYVFRPLLVPGTVLIWPMVLWRWWHLETGRDTPDKRHGPPRSLQTVSALTVAFLIPLIIFSALILRQDDTGDHPAIKIEEPR